MGKALFTAQNRSKCLKKDLSTIEVERTRFIEDRPDSFLLVFSVLFLYFSVLSQARVGRTKWPTSPAKASAVNPGVQAFFLTIASLTAPDLFACILSAADIVCSTISS